MEKICLYLAFRPLSWGFGGPWCQCCHGPWWQGWSSSLGIRDLLREPVDPWKVESLKDGPWCGWYVANLPEVLELLSVPLGPIGEPGGQGGPRLCAPGGPGTQAGYQWGLD